MKYKYSLHNKSKKHICPNCHKKRFVLYIDNDTGDYLSNKVGRCDREINCGYHYTPKQFFKDNDIDYNPILKREYKEVSKKVTFHSEKLLESTLKNYQNNNFIVYLLSLFPKLKVVEMINKYKIGTADFWYNGTIFWQIDVDNKIRGGKIISYQNNGKRTKYINWVHSYLLKQKKLKEFNLKQCFFGEHLINNSDQIIAIVESEKTACFMSLIFEKYLWIATGSLSGLSNEKLKILKNRKIVLYPDLGKNTENRTPYNLWKNKCEEYKKLEFDISISDLLERNATQEQCEKGLDIADYFIANSRIKVKRITSIEEDIYDRLFNKNNELINLIKEFDLIRTKDTFDASE